MTQALRVLMLAAPMLLSWQSPQWMRVTIKQANFSVEMPGKPEVRRNPLPGGGTEYNLVISVDDMMCIASYSDHREIKAGALRDYIKGIRMGVVGATKGHVVSERETSLYGMPGLDCLITDRHGQLMRVRILANRSHGYILSAFRAGARPDSPELERFFRSFRLLK